MFVQLPIRRASLVVRGGLLLVSLTLAGCAAADDAADGPKVAPAALGDYAARADAVCATARAKMAANLGAFEIHKSTSGSVKRGVKKVAKPEEVKAYVQGQLVHLEAQQTELRKLKLPNGEAGKAVTAIWDRADKIIDEVRRNPEEAAFVDPFKPIRKDLETLKFSQCFKDTRPKEFEEG
jgi:hypothetical protein